MQTQHLFLESSQTGRIKKRIEKFKQHQASHTHFLAVNHFHSQTKTVTVQLQGQLQLQQTVAAKWLRVIMTSVKYLAEEGLALRGHETEGGHLYQLPSCGLQMFQNCFSGYSDMRITRLLIYRMKF